MLKPVLDEHNKQMEQGTTGMTPTDAYREENAATVKTNSAMKPNRIQNYPDIGFTQSAVVIIPVSKSLALIDLKKLWRRETNNYIKIMFRKGYLRSI